MTPDCFVISLERTPERAMHLRARLDEFGILHRIFPAVDGLKGEHFAWPNYEEARCIARFGAPLTPAEIGTFASHYSLWRRCAENGIPTIILEDDVRLVDGFDRALAFAIAHIGERGLIRLAGLVDRRHRGFAELGERRLVRLFRGPLGTQAYMLSPTAAQRLLNGAVRWVEPVDLYLDRFWAHGVVPYAILPYPAVHLEEDALASTICSTRFSKRTGLKKLRREIYRVGEMVSRGLYNMTH